jgi:hypothetical protein
MDGTDIDDEEEQDELRRKKDILAGFQENGKNEFA